MHSNIKTDVTGRNTVWTGIIWLSIETSVGILWTQ